MNTQLMSPPADGGRNSIVVNGRVYSSTPGVAIHIPIFDALVLGANGWTAFVGSSVPTATASYSNGAISGVVTNPNGSPIGIAVRVYFDGSATPAGVTTADASGVWSIPMGSLASGSHAFSVELDESAGSFVIASSPGIVDFSNADNSGLLAAIAA